MQKPFPELTYLSLAIRDDEPPVPRPILPDSFLGGTAPRLRSLCLFGVLFSGLPKLLLSTSHLVYLALCDIPRLGYISSEVMATTLSALTSLETLFLRFLYPQPRPALESRRLPLRRLTRSILPRLTKFIFNGASEYLEGILVRIDAPRLNIMYITFFNQIIFNTPRLFQFISQVERPTRLRAPEEGRIIFDSSDVTVRFPSQASDLGVLSVKIPCTASERQLSSLAQVCTFWIVIASPFHVGRPLHLRGSNIPTTLARRCRKYAMAGSFTFICCCEGSLLIRGICTSYCACPARNCRWKNDRSFAHSGKYLLGGVPAGGTPR